MRSSPVVDAVAVDRVLALPVPVRDGRERERHALGGGVADVVHRADDGARAVALDRLGEQALAEVEARANRLHVGEEDRPEADVVEDQAPRLRDRLAALDERPRREDEPVLVHVLLRQAEAAGDDAAHVELVGLEVDEGDELVLVEDGPTEEEVVDVRAGAVGIVRDDHVARLEAVDAVLLDRVADGVGHRPGEEHDRRAHRRGRIARPGRARDRRGEVVEVAQDRRERGRQELPAHVLDEVAEAVGEHRGGETVAAVARGEFLVAEVADERRVRYGARRHGHLDPSCSITISPKRPISATCPGQTNVVASASRMTAGPRTSAPTGSASRTYSPASRTSSL